MLITGILLPFVTLLVALAGIVAQNLVKRHLAWKRPRVYVPVVGLIVLAMLSYMSARRDDAGRRNSEEAQARILRQSDSTVVSLRRVLKQQDSTAAVQARKLDSVQNRIREAQDSISSSSNKARTTGVDAEIRDLQASVDRAHLETRVIQLSADLAPFTKMASARYPQLEADVALQRLATYLEDVSGRVGSIERVLTHDFRPLTSTLQKEVRRGLRLAAVGHNRDSLKVMLWCDDDGILKEVTQEIADVVEDPYDLSYTCPYRDWRSAYVMDSVFGPDSVYIAAWPGYEELAQGFSGAILPFFPETIHVRPLPHAATGSGWCYGIDLVLRRTTPSFDSLGRVRFR